MTVSELDHLQVGHSDTMHTESWRIEVVQRIETQYPGCDDHTVGVAVLNR